MERWTDIEHRYLRRAATVEICEYHNEAKFNYSSVYSIHECHNKYEQYICETTYGNCSCDITSQE